MKKILIAFDGHLFSEGAFAFAQQINELHPVLLTGVFLPQEDFANLWSYADSGLAGPMYIPFVQELDTSAIEKNIENFERRCQLNGIDYRVHKNFIELAIPELKRETRFADLLIIGGEKFYQLIARQQPNDYLRNVLHDSECPVIVVPENFTSPSGLILAYDGSASSVFAIKQFAHLFPQWCGHKTTLVYAGNEAEEVPDKEFIEELAVRHFKDLTITKLNKEQKKHFADWLLLNKNPLLVTGAFGRSDISQLFRKSFVAEVIATHKTPVFIAHV
jgi:hypothetical protein